MGGNKERNEDLRGGKFSRDDFVGATEGMKPGGVAEADNVPKEQLGGEGFECYIFVKREKRDHQGEQKNEKWTGGKKREQTTNNYHLK